jgi:hypothetical protein
MNGWQRRRRGSGRTFLPEARSVGISGAAPLAADGAAKVQRTAALTLMRLSWSRPEVSTIQTQGSVRPVTSARVCLAAGTASCSR